MAAGASIGRQSAGWETWWNIRAARAIEPPPKGWGAPSMNFVGLTTKSRSVLEAGGYRNEADFVQLEPVAYHNLFLRGGFFPSADGMVSIAAGATVGGGSTVNWSNSLRTPMTVRNTWATEFGLTDVTGPAFDEHLAAVFERIGCCDKVAVQNEPHHRLSEGAAALDYSYDATNLNIDPEHFDPALIGYSGMGDQTGAKQGTMKTFLQDASDAGAQLLPGTRADRIVTRDGVAAGIEATYTDPATGQAHRVVINAPQVVAAAGSLETPALLLRSGIGGPAVGAGLRLHPATLVSGIYDERQEPWFGPAMAGVMNEFAEAHDEHGYLIECVQHLPGLFTTTVPWLSGAQHKELAQQYKNRADWVVLVKDRGEGSVTIDADGEALHWYPFTDELDRRHFREGIETSIRMHAAAGAQQIYAAGQPFAPWQRGEDIEAFIEKVNALPIGPGGTPVFSAHQMSSARMGADPQTSVANPSGELHDTPGVWIADADGRLTHTNPTAERIWGGRAPLVQGPSEYGVYRAFWPATGEALRPEEWALARTIITHGIPSWKTPRIASSNTSFVEATNGSDSGSVMARLCSSE